MQGRQQVAAVILAAGESRRFGGRKQLAELNGRTLLEHVLELARAAGLDPLIAVVPAWMAQPHGAEDVSPRWIVNADPELGMSHSLRLGFDALPATSDAAVILLGDQPTLATATIHALLAARGEKPIIATRAAGHLAAPVLVERSHFAIVQDPAGDIGLREILSAHPEWVRAADVAAHAPDIDTPGDLEALRDG
jgi:molybdenum cofactor cytidylyltransferase